MQETRKKWLELGEAPEAPRGLDAEIILHERVMNCPNILGGRGHGRDEVQRASERCVYRGTRIECVPERVEHP